MPSHWSLFSIIFRTLGRDPNHARADVPYPIVYTNQSTCYDSGNGATATCSGNGYDADYQGNQPSYTLSEDGLMMIDNVTGSSGPARWT
jgi:hypothetical protein